MEFLKKLLSSETIDEVNELLGEELANQVGEKLGSFSIDIATEKLIPKQQFDKEREQVKAYREELEARDKQLTELSKATKGNAELTLKIKELQEGNTTKDAEHKAQITKLSQEYALKDALSRFKPKNAKALEALLNKEGLSFEEKDGSFFVKGLDDQINALKQSDAYLFDSNITAGTQTPQAGKGLETKPANAWTQPQGSGAVKPWNNANYK